MSSCADQHRMVTAFRLRTGLLAGLAGLPVRVSVSDLEPRWRPNALVVDIKTSQGARLACADILAGGTWARIWHDQALGHRQREAMRESTRG